MKITQKDVEHVAQLARLQFSTDQLVVFTEQLNALLSYFDKLQEIDTTGVEPSTHAVTMCNAFREDRARPSIDANDALRNAPTRERGCFKVPKIIEG